jgi:hypothetical protein
LCVARAAQSPSNRPSNVLFDRLPTTVTKDGVQLLKIVSSASKQGSCCVTVLPPGEVSNTIHGTIESIVISGFEFGERGLFYV